jgi:uncharacterized protein (TIGR03083 family)
MTAGDGAEPVLGAEVSADTWIEVARRGHDDLAGEVSRLNDEALARTSGSRNWDVAQVLGHLGSQAEIGAAALQAALGERAPLEPDFNPQVWARWNALGGREKADGFLEHSDALTRRYEELDPETRASLRIDLGFLPRPADLATVISLRLNELALHAWDVKVANDPAATLLAPAASLLIDRFGALIGFIGHADALGSRAATIAVETTEPQRSFGIDISDAVRLVDQPAAAAAKLSLPAEAWLRLIAGRLRSEHTPPGVKIAGEGIELDDLRRVFPGY